MLSTMLLADCIMLAIYAVILAVTVAMVIRRRHLQPLRFRDPWLLIATVTSTFFANGTVTLRLLIDITNCYFSLLIVVPMLSMMVFLSFRFLKLLMAYQITQARITNGSSAWMVRWLSTPRGVWSLAIANIAVYFGLYLALGLTNDGCFDSRPVKTLNMCLLMLYWAVVAILTWVLRNVQDGFFVVRELKMLGPVLLLTNIMIMVVDGFPPIPLVLSSLLQLSIQMLYPLWKSYQMASSATVELTRADSSRNSSSRFSLASVAKTLKTRHLSAGLTKDATFLDVLRHPDGYEAMKQFLMLEFSVENLLCWRQLHDNRRERRPEQVEAQFRAIYETFIRKGSLNEVNINSQLKRHFKDVYHGRSANVDDILKMKAPNYQNGGATPDQITDVRLRLLKALYQEMVRLMQMDSFQRFRNSKAYQVLVQDDDDRQNTASAPITAGQV